MLWKKNIKKTSLKCTHFTPYIYVNALLSLAKIKSNLLLAFSNLNVYFIIHVYKKTATKQKNKYLKSLFGSIFFIYIYIYIYISIYVYLYV